MRKATFLVVLPLLALAAPRIRTPAESGAFLDTRHGDDEHDEAMVYADHISAMDHDDMTSHHTEEHNSEDSIQDHDHLHTSEAPSGSSKADAASAAAHGASHHHGSHTAPKTELNDADIHYWHSFPPSYLAADFRLDVDTAIFGEEFPEDWVPENAGGRRGLVSLHIASMLVAYFGILPVALVLRAAEHPLHYLINGAFLSVAVFSWSMGAWYKSATPDRYEGEAYSGMFTMLVLLSLGLGLLDSFGLLKRAAQWWRTTRKSDRRLASLVDYIRRSDSTEGRQFHRETLYELSPRASSSPDDYHPVVFEIGEDEEESHRSIRLDTSNTGSPVHSESSKIGQRYSHSYRNSRTSTGSSGSDHTLRDSPTSGTPPFGKYFDGPDVRQMGTYDEPYETGSRMVDPPHHDSNNWNENIQLPTSRSSAQRLVRLGEMMLTWVRRMQVVIAYVAVLMGVAVYTGMCRASFLPSCAAHYIKGSIFFGYGVITFARYLGAYSDLGWSWNRAPAGYTGPTAEMVECAIIFLYGATNTWMERFGAKPGDPYSVKQVQHISIAVMFWFAGLSGILLESKTIRRLLGSATTGDKRGDVEPASYSFSFNPLPALVIAVTGLAMAAHHQDYVFQVEIHSLWGILLAGGSAFRIITYTFLWLKPPVQSSLPSRPPTEILAAFGWAAGGIVFILSSEEVMHAAMRAGYDDMMAFLNVTVALVALVFCWVVVVMAVKGWAVLRVRRINSMRGQQS